MNNHIASATVDIFNGLLHGTIQFSPGLNIISGENGTLKTRLLQSLKSGSITPSVPGQAPRMQAISPKRNSERRAVEGILQSFRQHNRTWETTLSERLGGQINDQSFDNYPSLGDLFYLVFEHRCRDGANRQAHMLQLTNDLNSVIQAVFPHYSLVSVWDVQLGAPRIRMRKRESVDFPIEALSLGEQEVLSLIASIDAARDRMDVYLIDEPEVHLNWHLEDRLFAFLDDFCNTHGKQIVVVTHSRTIFKPRFLPKAQFLYWSDENTVKWSRDLSNEQRRRLAGDAIEVIALGDFSKPTFFVEDAAHTRVLRALGDHFGMEISTSECGNSSNVKSLFLYQKAHGRWSNAVFVIDGDNQGNPVPGEPQFVQLPVYCIENLFLEPAILAVATGRTTTEVQVVLAAAIVSQRAQIFRKNKFFEFLADSILPEHMTYDRLSTFDGSLILSEVLSRLGTDWAAVAPRYISIARERGWLASHVPAGILSLFDTPPESVAGEQDEQQHPSDDPSSSST